MQNRILRSGFAGAHSATLTQPASSALSALSTASGQGITVGIISDSFDALGGAGQDETDGQLPAASDINILKDDPNGTDEGRAMAQLIHAIAPDAKIDFYSGDYGQPDFAAGIASLHAAGATVIVDDLAYVNEPFYQLGSPIDSAIHSFVAGGGTYVTAAGNAGPDSSFEAHFNGVETYLPGIGQVEAMNFGTAEAPTFHEHLSLTAGLATTIDLQWAQPWTYDGTGGSNYSLAFALYGPGGHLVHVFSGDASGADPDQVGFFTPKVSGNYSLAVYTNDGSDPGDMLKIIGDNNSDAPVVLAGSSGSGSIYGHALSPYAITAGADDYLGLPSRGGTPQAENFTSTGPGLLLRTGDGQVLSPPAHLQKANFAGPDGLATSVPDLSPFFGTSAAAAEIAGDAALLLQGSPGLTSQQVGSLLASEATFDGSPLQSGRGLVDAQALGAAINDQRAGMTNLDQARTFSAALGTSTEMLSTHLDQQGRGHFGTW